MNSDDVEQSIRRRIRNAIDAAPEPAPFPADRVGRERTQMSVSSRSNWHPRAWLVAAVLVVIVVAVGGVWAAVGGTDQLDVVSDSDDTDAAEMIEVELEVVSYTQTYELACPDGPPEQSGQFDAMTIETTASTEQQRWKQAVTYPDGSARTLLHIGSPWYPTAAFASGKPNGQTVGCPGSGVLLAEPSPSAVFMLNPLAAIPDGPDGSPAVPQYDDLGELVPGDHRGPDGDPVELWRESISGFRSFGTEQVPLRQTTEWLIDPSTSRVVEQRFEQSFDGVGTISWTATLEGLRSETVDASELAQHGMQQQELDDASARAGTPTTTLPSD